MKDTATAIMKTVKEYKAIALTKKLGTTTRGRGEAAPEQHHGKARAVAAAAKVKDDDDPEA